MIELAEKNKNLNLNLITTREGRNRWRINRRVIRNAVNELGLSDDLEVYVCGPRGMPEFIQEECKEACGIDESKVNFELWR